MFANGNVCFSRVFLYILFSLVFCILRYQGETGEKGSRGSSGKNGRMVSLFNCCYWILKVSKHAITLTML